MLVSLITPLEVVLSLATSLVFSPCHGAVDDVDESKVAHNALKELDLLHAVWWPAPWKKKEVCSENKLLLSAKNHCVNITEHLKNV